MRWTSRVVMLLLRLVDTRVVGRSLQVAGWFLMSIPRVVELKSRMNDSLRVSCLSAR